MMRTSRPFRLASNAARCAVILALTLLAVAGTPAMARDEVSPLPSTWRVEDTRPVADVWYTVEAARFPSSALASGVAAMLRDLGWGPVVQRPVPGTTSVGVYVGETADLAEAHWLREELAAQEIVEGRVVALELEHRSRSTNPRGFSGPILKPYSASPRLAGEPIDQARLEQVIRNVRIGLSPEESAPIGAALEHWQNGDFSNPAFGDGMMAAADRLYRRETEPEVILLVAERIARGSWGASPSVRLAAMERCADLYLGERRDWRAAFVAVRDLQSQSLRSAEQRALDLLRAEALNADLIARGVEPAPSMNAMRARLFEAYQQTPWTAVRTRSRIALMTIQTFAWEGRWDRVEVMADEYVRLFAREPGPRELARILLARSKERRFEYREALRHLDAVLSESVPPDARLRVGVRTVDETAMARGWREYFSQLEYARRQGDRPAEVVLSTDLSLAPVPAATDPQAMLPAIGE